MAETLKVKSAGRFGSRYGFGIRKKLLKVETAQLLKHTCPKCGFARVKRLSKGIFLCKKCKSKFAGGTYLPSTMTGTLIRKMVLQKRFMPYMTELIEATEKKTAEVGEKEAAEVEEKQQKEREKIPEKKEDKKEKKNKKEKEK